MDKLKKTQILKVSLIAALLIITPLLSSSLRPAYLYFVVNLLIVALGAEAGLLSLSKVSKDKINTDMVRPKPVVNSEASQEGTTNVTNGTNSQECSQKKEKMVQKSTSNKIVGAVKVHKVKKCPSTPSLFFIGGGGGETETRKPVEDDEEGEVGGPSGQELYHKAETFIGNFYKQLKMQREESWKKIHGLYHKAF